ncbi:hypothetical protein BTO06_15320 [Tenacibaculum sp. SZ-18]|nr:hypothetical protein BTO06_15320 [Tenacibaculum sp. SZ-18]
MMLFYSLLFSNSNNELLECGVVDTIDKISKDKREGRKLFNANCASCHKLDKHMIGPALRNINLDSLSLKKYLNSERHSQRYPQLTTEQQHEILKYTKD